MDPIVADLREQFTVGAFDAYDDDFRLVAYVLRHIRDELETGASQLLIHSLDDAITYIDKRIEGLEK